jgi:hypothetical protein
MPRLSLRLGELNQIELLNYIGLCEVGDAHTTVYCWACWRAYSKFG